MKDEYGIIGITTPREDFFLDLLKPINQKLVEKCKYIFKGIEQVKVVEG